MSATMTSFATYTADNPPQAARASLKCAKASFGFIPNLQATIGRDVAAVAWRGLILGLSRPSALGKLLSGTLQRKGT
jgi:hypothetical protein